MYQQHISLRELVWTVLLTFFIAGHLTGQSCGYGYSKTITIDHNKVSGTQVLFDFPVLISLTDNDLRTTANGGNVENANGYDIVFVDEGSGQRLAHQVERYVASTGNYVAWVRVPKVYPQFDTRIKILYGNAQVSADPSTSETWDDNFQAVWHLHDDVLDGSQLGNDGTNSGTSDQAGKIADGRGFDGSTDHIYRTDASWNGDVPALSSGSPDDFTLSGWINVDNLGNRQPLLSKQGSGAGNDRGFVFMMEDDNRLKIELFKNNTSGTRTEVYSTSTLTTGTWYYMVATYRFVTDGTSECSVYLNGVEEGSTATALGPIFTNSRDVEIGRYYWSGSTNYWMDGEIDEVRISNNVRSADWIATEYENQNDPSSFYSVGAEVAGVTNPAIPVCGAGYKKVITIDETEIPGTTALTDFPVLINMTDTDLRTTGNGGNVENANGWDITFTDENLVPLDHDLETYDASTGELVAWVRVPSLPADVDYDIYMFYGNPDVFVDPSTPCTWADFHAVWHLHDDFLDATVNDEDGTNNGSTDNTTSQIADGQSFDGGDFIELSSFPNVTTDFTISGWIRTTDNTEPGQRIFCDDESNTGGYALSLGDGGTGQIRFYSRSMNGVILDGSTNAIANNTWYYVAGVVDRTNQDRFIYINGVQNAADLTDSGTWGTDAGDASIGGETAAGETANRFEGLLDEIRIASTVRSADWLVAEYNNQSNPSNFYSVGSEQNLAATSTQNGDWDLTTTWSGGAVPADGSNVTIQHDVDLDDRDIVLCNLTIETASDVESRLDVQGNYDLTVTEDVFITSNAGTAVDATLRTQVGNARVTVQGDLIADQTSGDDLYIQLTTGGDSLIVEGNLIMTHSGGDDMEILITNATAGLRVNGNFTAEMTDGTDDAFDVDLNAGGMRVLGTTSLSRYNTFGDLHIDLDGGDFRTDSLYMSSSGGSGTDQVMVDMDEASVLTVDNNFIMNMGGGDDHRIYLNVNAGTAAQLNVGNDLRIDKTGGDDLLIIVDDANSEINVGGTFSITSSGAEEVAFDLNDGELNVTDSLILRQLDNVLLMEFDMDGSPIVNLGTFVATLDNNGNQELLIDMDNTAIMNVTGDVLLTMNDGNDLEFHLGEESTGATAQLNVGGNLTLDHNPAAGGDDIQFIISDDSEVNVDGVFTMATDGTSAGNFYTRLNGTSRLNVLSNIVFTGANGSNEIELEMNETSALEIGGNFVRDGSPNNYGLLQSNTTTTTITYNGTGAQVFADDDGAGTDGIEYEQVVINNTHGVEPQLTMEGAVTLSNSITFTDGVLQTTSANLLTLADNATANGGNAGSYVSGPMQKVGNDDFVFALGKDGIWARLEISGATGAAVTDAFTAEYFRQPYSESFFDSSLYAGDPGGMYNTSTLEYWDLSRDAGTAQPIISLYWEENDSSVINDTMELVVAHYTGSNTWVNEGGNATGTLNTGKVSTTGTINSFSPFTFGSTSNTVNPLPVELLHFSAIPHEQSVLLTWSTASEINNDYFTVERSADGVHFEVVGTVNGAGNSSEELRYDLWDTNPLSGTSYYRLRQTDYDGSIDYSDVRKVRFLSEYVFTLYPNPAQTVIHGTIPFSGILTNANGQRVLEFGRTTYIEVSHLSKGVYFLHLDNGMVEKVVIE